MEKPTYRVSLQEFMRLFLQEVRVNHWPTIEYTNEAGEMAYHQLRAVRDSDLELLSTITEEEFWETYLQAKVSKSGSVFYTVRRWKRNGELNDRFMSFSPERVTLARMKRANYIPV